MLGIFQENVIMIKFGHTCTATRYTSDMTCHTLQKINYNSGFLLEVTKSLDGEELTVSWQVKDKLQAGETFQILQSTDEDTFSPVTFFFFFSFRPLFNKTASRKIRWWHIHHGGYCAAAIIVLLVVLQRHGCRDLLLLGSLIN